MKKTFPEVSEAHSISREAEKIFENLLSSHMWNDIKIPQERDFGLDYRVEAISEGLLKGCEFYAQVKGRQSIQNRDKIKVRIKASTARYWCNKLLPIAIIVIDCSSRKGYFAWFEKPDLSEYQRNDLIIEISASNELNDKHLKGSLEPYYFEFVKTYSEDKKKRFYRWLFNSTVLMMHMLLQTHNSILFCPKPEASKRRKSLSHYFTCLNGFIHEVKICNGAINLDRNPIDQRISMMLSHMETLHKGMYSNSKLEGMKETFIVKADSVYNSLPEVSYIFSELNLFFQKRYLTTHSNITNDNSNEVTKNMKST